MAQREMWGFFPWKLGYFSLLFFIPGQSEDFLRDSRLDSGKEILRGRKERSSSMCCNCFLYMSHE